jgi:hypothetical protein
VVSQAAPLAALRAAGAAASAANKETALTVAANSGIFGYINYLVEKDRKYILDTLVNGT